MVDQTHDHQIPDLFDPSVLTQKLTETEMNALSCAQFDFANFCKLLMIRSRLFTNAQKVVCWEYLAREAKSYPENRTMFVHRIFLLNQATVNDPDCAPVREHWFSAVANPNGFSWTRDERV